MREKQSGIYVITITDPTTGKERGFYIGSSVHVPARWTVHRSRLRRGTHCNPRLLNAWRKYGPSAFGWQVIALLPRDQLAAVETRLLARLCGMGECYNLARDATAPMRGRKASETTREKVRAIWSDPERRAAAADRARERPMTAETRKKMSASRLGIRRPPEASARTAAALRGRPLTAEHRAKLSVSHRGKKQSPETIARRVAKTRGQKRSPEQTARRRESMTAERRAKISAALRGRPVSPAQRAALCLGTAFASRSPEAIEKWRAAMAFKGPDYRRPPISDETREKLRIAKLGKRQSPETIAKRMAGAVATRERKRLEREAAAAFPAT